MSTRSGTPRTLFFSYAREDVDAVLAVARALRQRFDVAVHLDLDCEAGKNWSAEIKSWLESSDVLLVWVTPRAVRSSYVNTEVGAASAADVAIISLAVTPSALEQATTHLSSAQAIRVPDGMGSDELGLRIGAELGLTPLREQDSLDALLISSALLLEDCERDDSAVRRLRIQTQGALHEWRRRVFQVAVVALVKAGKSTTINAWLGDEFLPMSNVPETARVVRISHDELLPDGVLKDGADELRGPRAINRRIESLNKEARSVLYETPDLHLDVYVRGFEGAEERGHPTNHTRLEIIDTPGPNEAGATHLKTRSHAIISDAHAIVYVLDYSKLNTTDEAELLGEVAGRSAQALREWADRLFFLVNKIDQAGRHDLTVEETRAYVSKNLSTKLEVAIRPERIFAVSARNALLARLIQTRRASLEAREEFAQLVGGRRWKTLTDEDLREAVPEVLEESGFVSAEAAILHFVRQEASDLLKRAVAGTAIKALRELQNLLEIRRGLVKKKRSELRATATQLTRRLDAASLGFEELDRQVEQEQREMRTWTQSAFADFRRRMDLKLRTLGAEQADGFVSKSFQVARDAVRATARAALGEGDRPAEEMIQELFDRIVEWCVDDFSEFRLELQQEAFARQARLIERLKVTCTQAVRAIDAEVEVELELTLSPVELDIPVPTRLELHNRIDGELTRITAAAVRKEKHRVEKHVREDGFCGTPVWRKRWLDEYREVREQRLDVGLLVKHIEARFVDAFTASEKTATTVTFQLVKKHAKEAQDALEAHADRYRRTIEMQIQRLEADAGAAEAQLEELGQRIASAERLEGELQSSQLDPQAQPTK